MYTVILGCLAYLLLFPKDSLMASKEGLTLWLNTLMPTLLPFLILTNLLLTRPLPFSAPKLLRKLAKLLLGLSPSGLFCLCLGLLCGYPMGAKLTSDFYAHGKISRREANYLLAISCQASPAFLLGYLSLHIFQGKVRAINIFLPLLLADLVCMCFFRFVIYRNHTATPASSNSPIQNGYSRKRDKTRFESFTRYHGAPQMLMQAWHFHRYSRKSKKETPSVSSSGAGIDVSIMNGFETITRLGGYILLFSIISAMFRHLWPFTDSSSLVVLGFTELITGLQAIAASGYPFRIQYLLAMTTTGFGGICILFQTKSVLHKELGILPYLSAKVLQAALVFFGLLLV